PLDLVRIPDVCSAFANFKHRLWLTWYVLQKYVPQAAGRESFWRTAVPGTETTRDLWFWEDEDEEYIRQWAFTDNPLLKLFHEMPTMDWSNACRALETRRLLPRPTASPLAHLTPQTRCRFMAWLIVAEAVRKEDLAEMGNTGGLHDLIEFWGISVRIADFKGEKCGICRISHLLNVWLETMLEVYTLEDLRLLPWRPKCGCFYRALTTIVHAGENWATAIHPGRDSAAIRVLFELVVSPWPLMLWVAFRTVVHGRTGILWRFLRILRGPNRDLFTWDDIDAAVLYQALVKDSELGLLPRAWHRYMVEIDLRTWLQIRDITWTVCRPRSQSENLL
ncbi:hypothetical protein B0H14DRAFT_2779851, partial [Mycena olivaceomarginata]